MAARINVGENVYVPSSRIGMADAINPLYRTLVVSRNNRSLEVEIPGGETAWIASSLVTRGQESILLISLGDYSTETSLLDPLAKSLLQFSRLLMTDDAVLAVKCRSITELSRIWQLRGNAYSTVIIIGHGAPNGITFFVEGLTTAEQLIGVFDVPSFHPKTFISLCCETGMATFAKAFSQCNICRDLIAPYHNIHGAVASQFAQTFLSHKLLQGNTLPVSFKKSKDTVVGSASFRLWRKGVLKSN